MCIKTNRSRRSAFTLVEMMIAAGLSGLLLVVCLSMALYTSRSIAGAVDSVDMNARSRHAIDRMSKKLRQATMVTSFSTNAVVVQYKGRPLSYTYDEKLQTLVENENGTATTLLADCHALKFAIYQRNPVTNSFNQFPVASVTNEAKVIQVSWSCRRSLVGKVSGSSEMTSARIVLRTK
jgi:type II secretory pathway pseudopilin PulG